MFINTFKESIPYLFKANIAALVVGHHGVGKSQAVKQFAEEGGHRFVDLRLGTQDVGDLLGLPDFGVDKTGNKVTTTFMTPKWLKELIEWADKNPSKYGIIFLDEFNRARRDVLQAVFQLVLDRKMHTISLPSNVYVIAAQNPNTEDYIVTDVSDKALMDRFCHIKLTPSVQEWLEHAKRVNFSVEVTNFIKEQPELLQSKLEEFTLEEVKPSRRSWDAVSRLISAETPLPILQELCYGLVGHEATVAFMSSLKNKDKPITATNIIKEFSSFEDRIKKYSDNETGGRLDLIKYTCDDLIDTLKSRKKKLTKDEEKNILGFVKIIPRDLCFNVLHELYIVENCREMFNGDKEIVEIIKKARGKV